MGQCDSIEDHWETSYKTRLAVLYLLILRRRSTNKTASGRSTNKTERVVEMVVDDEWR